MPCKYHRLALVVMPVLLAAALVAGCGKYDHLERNMQYVSDELLHQDVQVAWDNLVKAHDAWRKAGAGREQDNKTFTAYQDAFLQYAIVYNELLDRRGESFSTHLHTPTDDLPPPPPGGAAPASTKAAPATAPASEAPKSHELHDSLPVAMPQPVSVAPKAAPAVQPAKENPFTPPRGDSASQAGRKTGQAKAVASSSGDSYVVAPGDTLRAIAKRLGVSEKNLMDANGITDPDKISAGKALTVPAH